ncbi:hypothetical protein BC567DRAFT_250157 [Phyllosticta citribraziliensis]
MGWLTRLLLLLTTSSPVQVLAMRPHVSAAVQVAAVCMRSTSPAPGLSQANDGASRRPSTPCALGQETRTKTTMQAIVNGSAPVCCMQGLLAALPTAQLSVSGLCRFNHSRSSSTSTAVVITAIFAPAP